MWFSDDIGDQEFYEPIAIIEHRGMIKRTGGSAGHYICDVKDSSSDNWFRTNDDCDPVQIEVDSVSKGGYVILYKRL